jgi:hypothetical protein
MRALMALQFQSPLRRRDAIEPHGANRGAMLSLSEECIYQA